MTPYALATCAFAEGPRPVLLLGEVRVDLAQCWAALRGTAPPEWLHSVDAIIARWAIAEQALQALASDAHAQGAETLSDPHPRLLAPFHPQRIFGAASNYIEHAAEMNTALAAKAESNPYHFMKSPGSVIGPGDTIRIPPETARADWEVELGVVIGRAGRRIRAQDALAHIAGYTIVNDISARDLNRRSDVPFKHDWFRGKSWDTFCPLGPYFV